MLQTHLSGRFETVYTSPTTGDASSALYYIFMSVEERQLDLWLGETIRCRASYEIPVVNLKKADNHVALEILITIYHRSQIIMREFVGAMWEYSKFVKKFKFACTDISPLLLRYHHGEPALKIFTRIGSDQNCIVVSRDGIKGVVSGR